MKALVAVIWCFIAFAASAQQQSGQAIDGTWLNNSLEAYARVVNGTANERDASNAESMISYVGGVIAVHRENNLTVSLLLNSLEKQRKASKVPSEAEAIEKQMRLALMFAPTLSAPENLSGQQIIAILRKHLNENPDKWGSSASMLISSALREAYARR